MKERRRFFFKKNNILICLRNNIHLSSKRRFLTTSVKMYFLNIHSRIVFTSLNSENIYIFYYYLKWNKASIYNLCFFFICFAQFNKFSVTITYKRTRDKESRPVDRTLKNIIKNIKIIERLIILTTVSINTLFV